MKDTKFTSSMSQQYFQDQTFNGNDALPKGEYENCQFHNCNFSNANLSEIKFVNCEFKGSNLSMANIAGAGFIDVIFKDCKMLGLRFDTCNSFGLAFSFDGCQLDHASFFKTKIKKTNFKNCRMDGVDFGECDLTQSLLENCNLLNAVFDKTNLEKADLRSSYDYSIDPENNKIRKARFSRSGVIGLLNKYDISIE